jgi:hypothetical protein
MRLGTAVKLGFGATWLVAEEAVPVTVVAIPTSEMTFRR